MNQTCYGPGMPLFWGSPTSMNSSNQKFDQPFYLTHTINPSLIHLEMPFWQYTYFFICLNLHAFGIEHCFTNFFYHLLILLYLSFYLHHCRNLHCHNLFYFDYCYFFVNSIVGFSVRLSCLANNVFICHFTLLCCLSPYM